jgi:acyl-CoA synthetase (AMP-forming)/AMP-acid ligase II
MQGDIARDGERLLSRSSWCQAVHNFKDTLAEKPCVIHLSRNRVNLMTAIVAVSAKGGRNLLPPDNKRTTIEWLRNQYPGAFTVGEPGENTAQSSDELSVDVVVPTSTSNSRQNSIKTGAVSPLLLDPEAEAVVAHTSGSTGTPKAVSKTWKSV